MAGGTSGMVVMPSSTIKESTEDTAKRGMRTSAGSEYECRIEHHVQAIDVVKRQKTEKDILGMEGRTVRTEELIQVGDQIEVRKHDPLGQAGGAARIGKGGQGLVRRSARLRPSDRGRREQAIEGLGSGCDLTGRVDAAKMSETPKVDSFQIRTIRDQQSSLRVF